MDTERSSPILRADLGLIRQLYGLALELEIVSPMMLLQ
jgi:hypothetical protein